MDLINKNMTLGEITTKYPDTKTLFKSKNITGFEDPGKANILNKLTLEMLSKSKKINLEILTDLLNSFVEKNETDITTEEREHIKDAVNVIGLLPCPIRIPLLESIKNLDDSDPELSFNYDLKSASFGSEWMMEYLNSNDDEKIPDIFLSTGFELFFSNTMAEKLSQKKLFKDTTGLEKYNKIFDGINLKDPNGNYAMIGVVPAVMLVNEEELNGRKSPKTWEDLLKPEFEKSVSIPMGDLDLYNAVIVTLHSKFGDEGIKALSRNFLDSLHPSQMIKADKLKVKKPAVTITPYFFFFLLPQNSPMVMNWPEDGAILSPIFMLIKNKKDENLEKITDFFASKKMADILTKQGYFPSIHPEAENNLNDKKFIWAGWDYLYENNIDDIIDHCTKILNENI